MTTPTSSARPAPAPVSPRPGPAGPRASWRAVRALLDEPCAALDDLVPVHGRTFAIGLGPLRLVVVGDAALVADVLGAPPASFSWRVAMRNLAVVTGPTAMMVSDGDEHRRRRRLAQPGFARRRLDGCRPLVVGEVDAAIDRLAAGAETDLHAVVRTVVRRIVVRIFFGEALAGRADEIGRRLEPAMAYAVRPVLRQLPHPLPLGARHGARRARAGVDRLLDEEIARRRAAAAGRAGDGGDLLDALLAAAEEDGRGDEEIRDQVVALIGAGYDTTSAAVSWLLVRALATPGVWAGLRAEAGADERPFTDAVVRETLRLHPVGPIAPRWVVEPVRVGDHVVPPRTMLVWSPYLLGRDPAHWAEPLRFRPDRFTGRDGDAVDELAWLPFGAGPRRCIGFALAQMEMQLIAGRMAERLDLEPRFGGVPPAEGMVVSRPRGGVPVRVTQRR